MPQLRFADYAGWPVCAAMQQSRLNGLELLSSLMGYLLTELLLKHHNALLQLSSASPQDHQHMMLRDCCLIGARFEMGRL
jgi:hypothetical protein